MSIFSKTPPAHIRAMNHPVVVWTSLGLLGLAAVAKIADVASGVAQALRTRRAAAPDTDS